MLLVLTARNINIFYFLGILSLTQCIITVYKGNILLRVTTKFCNFGPHRNKISSKLLYIYLNTLSTFDVLLQNYCNYLHVFSYIVYSVDRQIFAISIVIYTATSI